MKRNKEIKTAFFEIFYLRCENLLHNKEKYSCNEGTPLDVKKNGLPTPRKACAERCPIGLRNGQTCMTKAEIHPWEISVRNRLVSPEDLDKVVEEMKRL